MQLHALVWIACSSNGKQYTCSSPYLQGQPLNWGSPDVGEGTQQAWDLGYMSMCEAQPDSTCLSPNIQGLRQEDYESEECLGLYSETLSPQTYLTSRATDTAGPRELLPQLLPALLLCLCS